MAFPFPGTERDKLCDRLSVSGDDDLASANAPRNAFRETIPNLYHINIQHCYSSGNRMISAARFLRFSCTSRGRIITRFRYVEAMILLPVSWSERL